MDLTARSAPEQPSVSAFEELVREALLHLYEPAYLQTHPFAQLVGEGDAPTAPLRGKRLFQVLRDALEALRPPAGTARNSRAWRTFYLMELRYVEGLRAAEVIERLAISKAQYQRDHTRALQAIALFLRDRWKGATVQVLVDSREALALIEADYLADRLQIAPIDLVETLTDLVAALTPLAAENAITLRFYAPEDLPRVPGDRVALRQIFLGLLNAALVRAPRGRLDISIRHDDQQVAIEIWATAPAGFNLNVPPEPELSVAARLVAALGGRLDTRTVGTSTTWQAMVALPIARRPVLLVLDNHPDFVNLVDRYLADYAWEVIGAGNVGQARALARARRPNAILLDVMLPGEDGWDLLLALRSDAETKEIPVVVCSVLYEPQVARALGAAGYLPKPVSQAALLAAVLPWQRGGPASSFPTRPPLGSTELSCPAETPRDC